VNLRTSIRTRKKAAAIVEFVGALMLLIPLFIVLMFATYECVLYMYFKTGVDAAARTQARWLAVNYTTFSSSSASAYQTWINPNIRITGCVVSNSQFTNGSMGGNGFVAAPPTASLSGSSLGAVAVRVVYPGTNTGLPPWPNPPLSFFGVKILPPGGMQIAGTYSCNVEP